MVTDLAHTDFADVIRVIRNPRMAIVTATGGGDNRADAAADALTGQIQHQIDSGNRLEVCS